MSVPSTERPGGSWGGNGRSVALLSGCWALATSGNVLLVSVAALTGHMLATDKSLATLPIAMQWLGTAGATIPASLIMRRIGRRLGFVCGIALGVTGATSAALAVYYANFALLCLGIGLLGAYNGFNAYYRFAAADAVPEAARPRAISLVLAGGVVAAILGPWLARGTKDLFGPYPFMGAFAAMIALALIILVVLPFVRIPRHSFPSLHGGGRPMGEIMRQPVFIVAALGGALGYGVMVLLMSVTPLAMVACNHAFSDAATVIQWHVLGMFAPAFFTGHLIRRFGVLQIMLTGAVLLAACVAVAVSGITVAHFWIALTLLGLGWNFCYVAGSTLLAEAHTLVEQAKAQGMNDFLVFAAAGLASFFSGNLLHHFGWATLNMVAVLPIVLVAGAALLLLIRRRAVPAVSG